MYHVSRVESQICRKNRWWIFFILFNEFESHWKFSSGEYYVAIQKGITQINLKNLDVFSLTNTRWKEINEISLDRMKGLAKLKL